MSIIKAHLTEPVMEQITYIPLADLHESPFNTRQIFDEAELLELATDIRAQGRVLSPLLVRPIVPPLFRDDPHGVAGFEIVFGHRRFRAAGMAELLEAPCMVRAMTDAEARRAQISENLQRKDVHPIEEAEGFQALIDNDGETADTIAEKFGKSRSYVYGRLKLLEACPEIRKACLAGEIGSEVALLIARLRTARLQEKALGYIKADWRAKLDDGGKASYRSIRSLLAEKFTLELEGAMFDIEDEMLLPLAGNCVSCPKRSSNAPEYQDIAEGITSRYGSEGDARPNVCTDPDCFDAKKKAHLQREAGKLEAQGKVVVQGNTARNAISARGEIKGAYIALKDVQADLKKLGTKKTVAYGDPTPQVVLIQDPRTGKTHKAVKVADVKAAGVKVKDTPKNDQAKYEEQQRRGEAERAKQKVAAEIENRFRAALLSEVRTAIAEAPERSAFDLRLVAHTAFKGVDYQHRDPLARQHGFDDQEDLSKALDAMALRDLTLFIIDCALVRNVQVDYYRLKDQPEALLAAAAHYGVDVDAIRAEATGGPPTPASAARAQTDAQAAPAGAKGKPKAKSKAKSQKDNAGVAGGSDAQAELLEGAEA